MKCLFKNGIWFLVSLIMITGIILLSAPKCSLAQVNDSYKQLDIYLSNPPADSFYSVDLSSAPRQHVGPTYPDNPPMGPDSQFSKVPGILFNSFAKDAISLREQESIAFNFKPNDKPLYLDKIYFLINAVNAYQNTNYEEFGYITVLFDDGTWELLPLVVGDNIASWWSGVPNSPLALIFNDSMNAWSTTNSGGQQWGIGLLKLDLPQKYWSKVVKQIRIDTHDLQVVPPGTTSKVSTGLRFMGITLHSTKKVKITGVLATNYGDPPGGQEYIKDFKATIKPGSSLPLDGPYMPSIKCRAIRLDDTSSTVLSTSTFLWYLEGEAFTNQTAPLAFLPARRVPRKPDTFYLSGPGNDIEPISKPIQHNEKFWLLEPDVAQNWGWPEGQFIGGKITITVCFDVNGDGKFSEDEKDSISGTILGEDLQFIDEVKNVLIDSGGVCNGGVMEAICQQESGNSWHQFQVSGPNRGYPIQGLNFNKSGVLINVDYGLMQLNTQSSELLDGRLCEGAWNWKENIRGASLLIGWKADFTRDHLPIILNDLTLNHELDPEPQYNRYRALSAQQIVQLRNDFYVVNDPNEPRYLKSILARYNGGGYAEYSNYQPGTDSQKHKVYYGEYYHPEVRENQQGESSVTWEKNIPANQYGVDYADVVYNIYHTNYQNGFSPPTQPAQQTLNSQPQSLTITIHSPATLLVTDPIGRSVGIDPITGQTFNQVPNAIYTGSSITIPDPILGSYYIRLIGTGTGIYTLDLTVDNNTQSYTGQITLGQIVDYGLDLKIMPISSLTVSGDKNDDGSFKPPVSLVLSAKDQDGSGIAWIEYSLDNGSLWNSYFQPIILNTQGNYTILYRAVGNNGTVEQAKTATIEVKTSSESELPNLRTVEYRYGPPSPGYKFTGFIFESWLQVRIDNTGQGDAHNVTATIIGQPAYITVVDGSVTVGDIPSGSSAWSTDTFKLRVDLSKSQVQNDGIRWKIEYDDSEGTHHVINDVPQFPAAPALVQKLPLWYPQSNVRPPISKLYLNYPNPFNPETWLPYQIAEDADVNVKIFDAKGNLIKTISMGHKEAGFYISKDKAAYWDGKNANGEKVSSGIYFYNLEAGKFTDTRKMVIVE